MPVTTDTPEIAAEANQKAKGPKVSVGRIVHYRPAANVAARLNCDEGDHCAAIVTSVYEGGTIEIRTAVSLHVLSPARNSPYCVMDVFEGDGLAEWHWPERS